MYSNLFMFSIMACVFRVLCIRISHPKFPKNVYYLYYKTFVVQFVMFKLLVNLEFILR